MKVKEIMSNEVETIDANEMISEAAEKMRDRDIGVLPVMKEDEIAGVITDRDIVVRTVAEKLDPQSTPVKEAMTADAAYCFEDTDIEEAVKTMENKRIHRLLVLGYGGKIAGILSISDIAEKMHDEHLLCEVLEKICEPANA